MVRSIMAVLRSLDSSSILASSWTENVLDAHKSHAELVSTFRSPGSFQDKLVSLVRHKLARIVSLLKNSVRIVSNEKVTQSVVKATFSELRKETATAFVPYLSMLVLRFITEVLLISKDFFAASEATLAWFTIADIFMDPQEMLRAVELHGKCLRDRRLYPESIESFRKQLFLSWIVDDAQSEFRAYDCLGMSHFYLNDVDKAAKYHQKCVRADSELDSGDLHRLSLAKFSLSRKKRAAVLAQKNQFYRFSFMKHILEDPGYLQEERNLLELAQIQTNFTVFDESAVRFPEAPAEPGRPKPKSHRPKAPSDSLADLRSQQFKCTFSREGLLHSLKLSNPLKFELIQNGFLEIEPQMLRDIDLRSKAGSQDAGSILLTHQSQNKSAESFISYHNHRAADSEVCLEYVEPDIKAKLRHKVDYFVKLFELLQHNLSL